MVRQRELKGLINIEGDFVEMILTLPAASLEFFAASAGTGLVSSRFHASIINSGGCVTMMSLLTLPWNKENGRLRAPVEYYCCASLEAVADA